MRRFPVTVNPHMPATHTGIPPELPRRARRAVRPVIPAGQSGAYAGGGSGSFTGARTAPADGTAATPAGEECCG